MRVARLLLLAGWFGLIAGGCETDLELSLDGLRCNAEYRCSAGYACDRDTKLCVKNSVDAGLGGAPAGAGGTPPGGAGSGHSGSGGNAGVGGASPLGGQGGLDGGGGGAGGSEDLDAGFSDPIDGSDGCATTTVYWDGDNDGFGDFGTARVGCPGNGWVTNDADCNDSRNDVKPGQTDFFREGYAIAGGGVSFDYDCSEQEEPGPDNNTSAIPLCNGIGGVNCMGSGFLPVEPARQGPGVDPRCGSTLRRDCQVDTLLGCRPVDTPLGDELTFVCH